MAAKRLATTVRQSVALPRKLVEQARRRAPPELKGNMNRLVIVALQEFVARRQEREFEKAMAEMTADPEIRTESRVIAREFEPAERDGLA